MDPQALGYAREEGKAIEMDERAHQESDLEIDVEGIMKVLQDAGLDEGQLEQVTGRWIEAGFEDPREIEELIEQGHRTPEDARRAIKRSAAGPGERHAEQGSEPRDVVRGTTHSRSRPGDVEN